MNDQTNKGTNGWMDQLMNEEMSDGVLQAC